MRNVLLQAAMKLNRNRKRRKSWQRVVQTLTMVVVFCTTYALILPAITMQAEPICGMEAHEHTEACYTLQSTTEFVCDVPADVKIVHQHGDHCWDASQNLICLLPEIREHAHNDDCFTQTQTLNCPVTHVHSEACAVEASVLSCGLEAADAHSHSESCTGTESVQICTVEVHQHGEGCFEEQTLVCEIPESEEHTHSEHCTGTRSVQICTAEVHTHGEGCFEEQPRVCEIPEGEGHAHSEACYTVQLVPCDQPTAQDHAHEEACYQTGRELTCGLEELQAHAHSETCYDAEGNLICALPEILVHTHTEECMKEQEQKQLHCTIPEHIHEDACYPLEEEEPVVGLEFRCGFSNHIHEENCYAADGTQTCTIPEHTHEAVCAVAELDLNADVETPEQWAAAAAQLQLTGKWPEDVRTVAEAQLGYEESRKNVILVKDALKGYTRYGAKYDDPYGEWDSMFAAFVLEYAGVKDFPVNLDHDAWIATLAEAELYRTPGSYSPKPGDLIFFDDDQKENAPEPVPVDADRVAIVVELISAAEGARIKTIEGNVNGEVSYVTWDMENPAILGYGQMLPGNVRTSTLTFEGEDFIVTVQYGEDALLPADAILSVREIEPGTEEYEKYYQQSLTTLLGGEESMEEGAEVSDHAEEEQEEQLQVYFARFFDISFMAGEEKIEPAAPVDIQIQYLQGIAAAEEKEGVAVHFAKTGVEVLDAELTQNQEAMVDSFAFTQSSFSVSGTVLYADSRAIGGHYVWLDGTAGGQIAYTGSPNRSITSSNPYTLPTSWDSPTTYQYTLKGWYDVTNSRYYEPGTTVTITGNTVFYADWAPATYDIGRYNADVVNTVDTSEFITIDMFDYSSLFNVQSTDISTKSVSSSSHSETWAHVGSGRVDYDAQTTLDFSFIDGYDGYDGGTELTYANNRTNRNLNSNSGVTSGIVGSLGTDDRQASLLNVLFSKTDSIGKNYVGPANHLFQYDSDPSSEHFGYYYYDSEKNAASYNQSAQRFYVYDYVAQGSYSGTGDYDFYPLNSPYANNYGSKTPSLSGGVYQYNIGSSNTQTTANFFFGMKTNIHFYLPNDVGHTDDYGNPGNLDNNGNPMIFDFSGDDDVWVFVDNKLVLDLGGIHGAVSGSIDFSAGTVTVEGRTTATLASGSTIFSGGLKEGGHDLTIYYLERGSNESNCSIYFNLAPRYGMELKKQDYHTREALDGVQFGVYLDEACTIPANLWNNHAEAKADPDNENTTNVFTIENGSLRFFGLVAGKTYYIKELTVSEGYPGTDDLIRVNLNNHGTDISEVTVLNGSNGQRTQGYEIVSHSLDEVTQTVHLVLTNQRTIGEDEVTTHVRVTKNWVLAEENPAQIPDSITVHLTKDGEWYGHSMTLGPKNGWTYTWTGLPADGSTYNVVEDQVPGFTLIPPVRTRSAREINREYVTNWLEVGALEDGVIYLLKVGNQYLAQSGGSLTTVTVETGDDGLLDPPENALWTVTAVNEGFRLSNGGYSLTLDGNRFRASAAGSGNQTLYYDGDGLFAMSGGALYYMGSVSNGAASASTSVQSIGLVKQERIAVDVIPISLVNYQLEAENMTFLEVEKIWDTEQEYWDKEVTIHLLADGKDTGLNLILNDDNEWKATFEGLPIGPTYSVLEDPVQGYSAEYSAVEKVLGGTVTSWENVDSLAEGGKYTFVSSNGYALTAASNTAVSSTALRDPKNPANNQQWIYESGKLKSVSTGRYLRLSSNNLSLTNTAGSAASVSLADNKLRIQSGTTTRYLTVAANGISVSSSGSGTSLTVYLSATRTTADGFKVTVTNTYGVYELPKTGGMGTSPLTFGGLLMIAAALMYSTKIGRKQRKGGKGNT